MIRDNIIPNRSRCDKRLPGSLQIGLGDVKEGESRISGKTNFLKIVNVTAKNL